jgi:hypothetical protein
MDVLSFLDAPRFCTEGHFYWKAYRIQASSVFRSVKISFDMKIKCNAGEVTLTGKTEVLYHFIQQKLDVA